MFISRFRAGADDRSAWGNFWFEPVSARTNSGMRIGPDRAMQLPVVFACVRVLAETFGVLPIKLYRCGRNGKKKPVTRHWLLDLLCGAPNQWQTPYEWREMMQGHLALRGNAFNQIVTAPDGSVRALIPKHPDGMRLEPLPGKSEFDFRYKYTDRNGNVTHYAASEIWHLRGLSSDGIVGLNPIELARESVGLGLAAQDYGARFFANDATPGGGWIEFPGTFKDKAARENFRESYQNAQVGMNRGKVAVFEGGMKWHQLGLTNKDSQFLEARQFQVGDIARMFRVPPHLVGDLSKATFSNIEQQSLEFVIYTMTPWVARWESAIKTWLLLSDDQDLEVQFDFAGLLRGDAGARSMYYHNGILDGWMTRNEARENENYEPIEGLDEPLMPLNMVPVSEAGKTQPIEPEKPTPEQKQEPKEPENV
ncbi:phage portal protein [Paraburkholderia tuberum]|uniref:Phage portal protein, HK97 family n=1 Tax=Paraburkholderia tuberum TaxID=157910 RepID=A0A1H1JB54_9BURK|nr:phage portal protein [Paraburkholderia tuberum]SDR47151.1 phage portal protein, HK97 family [Paraburkholderia tuberum]